jgi:hypothetical protein
MKPVPGQNITPSTDLTIRMQQISRCLQITMLCSLFLGRADTKVAIEFHDVDHSLPPVPPIFHKAGRRSRERSKPWELGRHLHGLVK